MLVSLVIQMKIVAKKWGTINLYFMQVYIQQIKTRNTPNKYTRTVSIVF